MDSELAMLPQLGQAPKRFGFVSNPVFRQADAQQISPANGVLMVARLDGPSPKLAKRLVDRAVDAESSGLWGRAYIDLRGISVGQFKVGDDRLRKVAEIMRRSGFATVVDEKQETLPVGFPASHIAFYAGWYGINVEGVFAESTVEFMPGAIAYHLHSFNGSMIRDAHARWIGPFINKGVTATFGTVYEPYLELTPDLPLFFSRLISDGFTFGEAGYASSRALSWQTVFVGDPLYRPFGKSPEEVKAKLEQQNSPMLEWFHLLSVNQGLANGAPAKAAIEHLQQLPETKGSSVLQEKLGELLAASGQAEAASAAYSAALKSSTSPKQKQRLTEEQARQQEQAP
ncbi:MAG: TIGR03790 family protein [Verrucomicrobia bacterium]|nr:TIGR03790 family protein [Verrucomicrobiota bacterium]